MTNGMLPENQRKEAISHAFLLALAARSGYLVQSSPRPDWDSVDATVRCGSPQREVVDVQLKATAAPDEKADGLHFRIKRKNYNDLAMPRATPLFLIVVQLPAEEPNWIDCTVEKLVMRKCAWWLSLLGRQPVDGESRSVVIPPHQRIGDAGLEPLFTHARET